MWTCNHVECFPIDLCNWISFERLSFKIGCTSRVWLFLTLLGLMVSFLCCVINSAPHCFSLLTCETFSSLWISPVPSGSVFHPLAPCLHHLVAFITSSVPSNAFPDLADAVVLISLASSHHLLKNILATLSPTQLTREFSSVLFFRIQLFWTKEFVSTTMFQPRGSAGVLPLTSFYIFNLLRMLVGYSVIPTELVRLQSQHSVLLSPHCVLSSYLSRINMYLTDCKSYF